MTLLSQYKLNSKELKMRKAASWLYLLTPWSCHTLDPHQIWTREGLPSGPPCPCHARLGHRLANTKILSPGSSPDQKQISAKMLSNKVMAAVVMLLNTRLFLSRHTPAYSRRGQVHKSALSYATPVSSREERHKRIGNH